jgi:hypothetical protein
VDRAFAAVQMHRSIEAKQQEVSAQSASFQAQLAALLQQAGSLAQQQAANSGGLVAFFGDVVQQMVQLQPITAGTQQGDGSPLAMAMDADDAAAMQPQGGGEDSQHEDDGHDELQGFVAGTQVGRGPGGCCCCCCSPQKQLRLACTCMQPTGIFCLYLCCLSEHCMACLSYLSWHAAELPSRLLHAQQASILQPCCADD